MKKIENIFSSKDLPALNDRIYKLVDYYAKGSVKAFSEMIGLSNSQKLNRVFNIDRRNNDFPDVSSETLIGIANKFSEINTDWLLTGHGSMLKDPKSNQTLKKAEIDNLCRIPMVDISVAAGSGIYNGEYLDVVDCISLPQCMIHNGRNYLCVRIKGQSMSPSMLDGGYLVIYNIEKQEWQNIKDNYVYVVCDIEGRAFVKRIKNRLRDHGFIVCMSDNADKQNYSNFNIEENELNTIWFAEWYFTAKIPNIQETYYQKQAELENRLDDLFSQFQQFQRTISMNNK